MNTPIFLRDLQPELRAQIEADIEKRPSLFSEEVVKAIEQGNDVTIGTFLEYQEYNAD